MLIYEALPARPVRVSEEADEPNIEYASTWEDFTGMGCSILAIKPDNDRTRIFSDHSKEEGFYLIEQTYLSGNMVCSWNARAFVNPLLRFAWGTTVREEFCYDVAREIYRGADLDPDYNPKTHSLFTLPRVYMAQAGVPDPTYPKGMNAGYEWQKGNHGRVVDYAIDRIAMLAELVFREEQLRNPADGKPLDVASPLQRYEREEI